MAVRRTGSVLPATSMSPTVYYGEAHFTHSRKWERPQMPRMPSERPRGRRRDGRQPPRSCRNRGRAVPGVRERAARSDRPWSRRLAVAALSADCIESLKTLLNHQADEVRVAAVAKLASTLSKDQLEAVLDTYLQQEQYFYNVYVGLDRLVFA
jgi:hypothetical protein